MLIRKPSKMAKVLSYIFPIKLYKKTSDTGPTLIVQMYKGQLQLAYGRVFYSDGYDYFPIKKSIEKIGLSHYKDEHHFLCLGSGLGSLTYILHDLFPDKSFQIDYVDINADILHLCEEATADVSPNITHHFIQADANQWMKSNQKSYDHIIVDIFDEHVVPLFVFKRPFLQQLHNALHDGQYLIMNMMFHSDFQQHEFEIKLAEYFSPFEVISTRKNKIYIAQKKVILQTQSI